MDGAGNEICRRGDLLHQGFERPVLQLFSLSINPYMIMKILLSLFYIFYGISLFSQNTPETQPPFTPSTFSVWSQRMDMSQYVGKKYRLTVAIRAKPADSEAFAVAFIRNEPPQGGLRAWTFMDNMFDRPVRDSTWKTYTLESTVDKQAPWIGFGILGFSNGVFYYDDMHLSVEAETGKWTPLTIQNGNFEGENLTPWLQTAQGVPVRVLGATATLVVQQPFEGKQCLRVENKFLKK
jgi:hypothetical protein